MISLARQIELRREVEGLFAALEAEQRDHALAALEWRVHAYDDRARALWRDYYHRQRAALDLRCDGCGGRRPTTQKRLCEPCGGKARAEQYLRYQRRAKGLPENGERRCLDCPETIPVRRKRCRPCAVAAARRRGNACRRRAA